MAGWIQYWYTTLEFVGNMIKKGKLNMDAALVSVITSGLVAILSLVVPIVIDYRKSIRESKFAKVEALNQTTLELLGQLSHFRYRIWGDIEESAAKPIQQITSELRSKHYAWERAIWAPLNQSERDRVKGLRKKFENVAWAEDIKSEKTTSEVSELSDEILDLSFIAGEKLES